MYIVRDLETGRYLSKIDAGDYELDKNYREALTYDTVDEIEKIILSWDHTWHDFEVVKLIVHSRTNIS